MKSKKNIKLLLTDVEKANLRKNKIKIASILDFATDELEVLLDTTPERAKEIHALAEFQTVPSVGIKFAEDLVFLGFYSLNELKSKDGAKLTDEYELKKGFWTDPCVEDQFRLVVNYANTHDTKKTWWDFTDERKEFRTKNGYPASRPQKAWFETLEHERKDKKTVTNKILPKAELNGFDWAPVQGTTFVLRLKFLTKNSRLRQHPNR